MRKSPITALARTLLLFIGMLSAVPTSTGCVGAGQKLSNWYYGHTIRTQEKHELADLRQETRVALAEQEREALRVETQRDIEAARLDAERRRLEMEFCQARQEALQRQVKRNILETVESKVAFNVEQGLEVGELEVDVEALQKLIEEREKEALEKPEEKEAQKKQPCACCDQSCRCGSGWIRRLCPHCRHKPCEAEKDCGGPEALERVAQEGQKRPLKPAEIPMKLPVRLSFGFQQPEMEAARIRRQPGIEQEALERPCDRCAEPGGNCPLPCTRPTPQQSPSTGLNRIYDYQQPQPTVPTAVPDVGPPPVPDAEARRPPEPPHGARFGKAGFLPNRFASASR